ncbi:MULTISPECIES: tyrosine-type recombinase/integrase [Bradyrhizobium]|uniref:Tyrosine-type recombinase/integrase n=1 Tax=Bradyrhizobium septentrionale TaxID=1404411 RepID=A0ABZ2PAT5_9BRAD
MAQQRNRLSARSVATITKIGRHADGGNLYLSISPNGGRRWTFLFRWRGKTKEIGLGSARDVMLARARELATAARAELAEGRQPTGIRRPTVGETFGEVANRLVETMAPGWKNEKHAAQWRMTLLGEAGEGDEDGKPIKAKHDYCASLRKVPVAEVSTADVLAVLQPIWQTKPETASRIRGRIERALDSAKAQGLRTGENPARWRGHLDHLLAKRQRLTRGHHAALPYSDVPAFMVDLRGREAVAARALEFVILTAARTGEALGARWDEIDFDRALWTVPPERMKMGKEHRVPLSARALEMVRELFEVRCNEFVFPGQSSDGGLSSMALAAVLKRMKVKGATPHGFRSSFRDWAGDETAYPREVIEAALAHTIENKAEAAYRRATALEKRRELMAAWSSYCAEPQGGKVVQLRR